jgi:hypothetical protein
MRGASTYIGTNQASYVPAVADAGSTIKVQVTRIGNSGYVESASAAARSLAALRPKMLRILDLEFCNGSTNFANGAQAGYCKTPHRIAKTWSLAALRTPPL